VYASLADARAEGVTEAQASDERLLALLEEATLLIDRATGWFFEPRDLTLRLDGRGTPSIEPPVPPIQLDRLELDGSELSLDWDDLVVVGAPVPPRFEGPRLTLRHGRRFTRGDGNVVLEGRFGYTEPDGTSEGRTPPAIRRACLLLVLRNLALLTDEAAIEARTRWRIVEEQTRDQRYRLGPASESSSLLTGDPDIDALLAPYRRPMGLGAA
jgi:hypothetical protein